MRALLPLMPRWLPRRARTEKAIAACASLADRLDALANQHSKPWWRRLAG